MFIDSFLFSCHKTVFIGPLQSPGMIYHTFKYLTNTSIISCNGVQVLLLLILHESSTLFLHIFWIQLCSYVNKLRDVLLSRRRRQLSHHLKDFDVLFDIFHNNFIGIRTELLTPLPRTPKFKI